jgi:uncharacterized phiE125 gp8 family phage protein
MPLYRVSRSTTAAVSLADMKAHLRVDFDDDDDLIEAFTEAATQHLDGADALLGRALVKQTYDLKLRTFSCEPVRIPLPPLISVDWIKYFDGNNAEQTFSADVYEVAGIGGSQAAAIHLKSGQAWPTLYRVAEPMTIRFTAGYVNDGNSPPGEIPAPITAAIKLLVGTLYANRETVVIGETAIMLPWAAEALLWPLRVFA